MPIADAPAGHFEKVVDLKRPIRLRLLPGGGVRRSPSFRRQGKGNIINVTSIAGRTGGAGGAGIYGSAKAMVSSLTPRDGQGSWRRNNIRVNAVSPGVITTPFHEPLFAAGVHGSRQGPDPHGPPGHAR